MAQREQIRRRPAQRTTDQVEEQTTPGGAVAQDTKTAEELKAELDDLLDDIDSVLEKNAEEFVNSYIQKGGQ